MARLTEMAGHHVNLTVGKQQALRSATFVFKVSGTTFGWTQNRQDLEDVWGLRSTSHSGARLCLEAPVLDVHKVFLAPIYPDRWAFEHLEGFRTREPSQHQRHG